MAQRCSVCAHPERRRIDAQLVEGVANRRIAAQFDLSESSLRRHRDSHIPQSLTEDADARRQVSAGFLLRHTVSLHRRTLAILSSAEATEDHNLALRCIREARSNLVLLRDLTTVAELEDRIGEIEARIGGDAWVR